MVAETSDWHQKPGERELTRASDGTLASLLRLWRSRSQAVDGAAEDDGTNESDKNQAMVEASQEARKEFSEDTKAAEEEVRMEEILVGEETIEVPSDLYTDQSIFHQFFSVDTWNDLLPEEVKMGLLKLLPSFQQNDIDEKAKTIEMLFSGDMI